MIKPPRPPVYQRNTPPSRAYAFRLAPGNENRPQDEDAVLVLEAFLSEGWTLRDTMTQALLALGEKYGNNFQPRPPVTALTGELWEAIQAILEATKALENAEHTGVNHARQRLEDAKQYLDDSLDTTEMTGEGSFFDDEE